MADLDNRSKRASSVNFLKPYALDLVLPDGAIGQGDRQHTAWDYSGILATAPVVVVVVAIQLLTQLGTLQFIAELGTLRWETELN